MTGILETTGIIASIAFTVGALTLPIKDNVYWKTCEHLYLGFAAGYSLIIAINALNSNLIKQLLTGNVIYTIPLILGIMLYSRYIERWQWLNRYPVAVIVGVGTAISARTIIDAMIIQQIRGALLNPLASGKDIVGSPKTPINNILTIITVITVVLYFVFWQMKGMDNIVIEKSRKFGIIMLMGSFGVLIGNSIHMRVSRLGDRFFYLLSPENQLYTLIFTIIGVISIVLSGRKSKEL